jgi:hypothetical protein
LGVLLSRALRLPPLSRNVFSRPFRWLCAALRASKIALGNLRVLKVKTTSLECAP